MKRFQSSMDVTPVLFPPNHQIDLIISTMTPHQKDPAVKEDPLIILDLSLLIPTSAKQKFAIAHTPAMEKDAAIRVIL
jgi:hypothetical protein